MVRGARHYTGDWIERRRVRYRGGGCFYCWVVLRATKFAAATQDVIYRRKTWLLPKNTPPLQTPTTFRYVGVYIIHSHSPECPTTTGPFFIAKLSARIGRTVEINVLEFAVSAS